MNEKNSLQHLLAYLYFKYRVVQKTDTQFYGDNFGNSAPIITILSLLQAETYSV